jgi:hypothetical protein
MHLLLPGREIADLLRERRHIRTLLLRRLALPGVALPLTCDRCLHD